MKNKIKILKFLSVSVFFTALLFFGIHQNSKTAVAGQDIYIWWPVDNAKMDGIQPFKGLFPDRELNNYQMFWYVDNGTWNWMGNNFDGYPHKEASVDVSGWNWHGNGPYEVVFVVRDNQDNILDQRKVLINIDRPKITPSDNPSPTISPTPSPTTVPTTSPICYPAPTSTPSPSSTTPNQLPTLPSSTPIPTPSPSISISPTPTPSPSTTPPITIIIPPSPTPAPSVTPTPSNNYNLFTDSKLFINPNSQAKSLANSWRTSKPTDAALLDKIANQPEAQWFGDWNSNIYSDVNNTVSYITGTGAMPVFIAYNIPGRDCGGYSAGGSNSVENYKTWINNFANGIGNKKAAVILEPDALSSMDCLSPANQKIRTDLLRYAVTTLNSLGNVAVYLDAGNARWQSAATMANRLKDAGLDMARGFALNVSNFIETNETTEYGKNISALTNNKPFVIDTSRNGLGPTGDSQWCNPPGRALGLPASTDTKNPNIDAYLWLKVPGESDGNCNGGPNAGVFWPDYALGLSQRANW